MGDVLKKQNGRIIIILGVLASFLALASCSSPQTSGARQAQLRSGVGSQAGTAQTGMSRAELQDHLIRFSGNFAESLRGAFSTLDNSPSIDVRQAALDQRLRYSTAALDIALGPIPENNLLDMIVFFELCKDVLHDYWIPQIYGPAGQTVLAAFTTAESQLDRLGSRVLTDQEIALLDQITSDWRQEHPKQTDVEGVRMTEFSEETGARAKERQRELTGIQASVSGLMHSADQAVMLGERALYYAQRAPFLMRLQAKVAATELVDTSAEALENLPFSTKNLDDARSLLGELRGLLAESQATMRQGPELVKNSALNLEGSANRFLWRLGLLGAALIAFAAVSVLLSRIWYQKWLESRKLSRDSSDMQSGGKAA